MVARGMIPPPDRKPMSLGEAMELIYSIRNSCEIARMIYPRAGRALMYTLFEDLCQKAQDLLTFRIDERLGD